MREDGGQDFRQRGNEPPCNVARLIRVPLSLSRSSGLLFGLQLRVEAVEELRAPVASPLFPLVSQSLAERAISVVSLNLLKSASCSGFSATMLFSVPNIVSKVRAKVRGASSSWGVTFSSQ